MLASLISKTLFMCGFSFSWSRHIKTIKNARTKLSLYWIMECYTDSCTNWTSEIFIFFLKNLRKTWENCCFQIPKTRNFFSWLKILNRNFYSTSSALSFLRISFSLNPLIYTVKFTLTKSSVPQNFFVNLKSSLKWTVFCIK